MRISCRRLTCRSAMSRPLLRDAVVFCVAMFAPPVLWAQPCEGDIRPIGSNTVTQTALVVQGGGVALYSRMNINLDGYGRAYHRDNFQGGGVIHLCNAAQVFLPDGTSYQGSESNATCTGKFMQDYQKIRGANWTNTSVGAIRWFGVVGTGSVTIAGRTVTSVVPVEQPDGSGFYVSPTSLLDSAITDPGDQRRYVNPLSVPAAVVRNSPALAQLGVVLGTLGVAVHRERKIAVPFIVGDFGPRIGEGSAALARLVSGHPLVDIIDRKTRLVGQVDKPAVLWVFFGGPKLPPPYDAKRVRGEAEGAFVKWGGETRLRTCLANANVPVNGPQ